MKKSELKEIIDYLRTKINEVFEEKQKVVFENQHLKKVLQKQSMHIQRQQNIIRRHKAELTNLHRENRRKKEVIHNLIGEKMQLNKELSRLKNKYPGIGWDYEIV